MDFLCSDCPRACGAVRGAEPGGVCRSPALPSVARAAPHFGEEPCVSGSRGSGAVFFCGCNLRCVFCQNREISRGAEKDRVLTVPRLRELFLRLRDQGVHNINLVTGSQYVRPIAEALRGLDLGIPVVWNSSAYESVETLRLLEGLVQVYLPDLKYTRPGPAGRYSAAPDYPQAAMAAIREMFRQTGPYCLGPDGMLRSGVLIRHLILPGQEEAAMDAMDFAAEAFPAGGVLFSLMGQYTPIPGLAERFPELGSPLPQETVENLRHYMLQRGLEGYWQDVSSATEELLPAFDGTGLDP